MKNIPVSLGIVISLLLIFATCILAARVLSKLPPPAAKETQPAWSPDGQRLAYTCYLQGPVEGESFFDVTFGIEPDAGASWSNYTDEASDICIIDADGNNRIHLIQEPGADFAPVWSPDGSRIAYLRDEGIFVVDVGENHQPNLIWSSDEVYPRKTTWSPDGTQLWSGGEIYPRRIAWSPDGTQLLFSACQQNSDLDIYVVNVNDGSLINLTQNNKVHDFSPKWILDGTQIFFRSTVMLTGPETFWESCFLLKDTPHQMKVINADGQGERMIFEALYYPFIAVSDGGETVFSSDLVSKAEYEYENNREDHEMRLYKMTIDNPELTAIPVQNLEVYPLNYRITRSTSLSWWSPDGKKFLYPARGGIMIFNTETGETNGLPTMKPTFYPEEYVWSPDGQELAIGGYFIRSVYQEDHIYLLNFTNDSTRPLLSE